MAKYVVRYGVMRTLGVFAPRGGEDYRRGETVVARTPRGLELGEVLCEASDEAERRLEDPPRGQLVRRASEDDLAAAAAAREQARRDFDACAEQIRRAGLPMNLIDVERLFGGERVVVYYLSEERVDFRELVKSLAGELRTRVEMRQVGVRDEAKLLADYGDCGKPVCCNTHLVEMPPVSMKMAKLQKATLDPAKISGRCGRLKCCLRYEQDVYVELQRLLPRVGSRVTTPEGPAKVVGQEVLAERVWLLTEDGRRLSAAAGDVRPLAVRGGAKPADEPEVDSDSDSTSDEEAS